MRLDLYQAETERIAREQGALLDEAKNRLAENAALSGLEKNGLLHAFQILIENAIGKAKQQLKANGQTVPISAYDTFVALSRLGGVLPTELANWNAIIGLRNRIVHDYMNVDMHRVIELVKTGEYEFVVRFLNCPIPVEKQD
jgi:uncharacterized protein YutE (UPF0331/DUF86 family)